MTRVKQSTRISYKREPEKGEKGSFTRQSVWAAGVRYYSGAAGEDTVDYVYFNGYMYQCVGTHTSVASSTPYILVNSGDTTHWKLVPSWTGISTKVLLLGSGMSGWIMDEGVIKHTSGNITLTAAGVIETASGRYKVDANGKLWAVEADIKNSTLQDVRILGTMRSPFVRHDGSYTWDDTKSAAELHDNLLMNGAGSWTLSAGGFPWDKSQSGRRITITTHRYNGSLSNGGVSIDAPSGKYFFEDGCNNTSLYLSSREFVELLGIGEDNTFYGWLVVRRGDIETNKRYGRYLKVLAMGFLTGGTGTPSLTYKTFDGSTLSTPYRIGEGKYRIYIPSAWGLASTDYMVITTGYSTVTDSTTAPAKATLMSRSSTYFDVWVSDDASLNDGSFQFMIINTSDFTKTHD